MTVSTSLSQALTLLSAVVPLALAAPAHLLAGRVLSHHDLLPLHSLHTGRAFQAFHAVPTVAGHQLHAIRTLPTVATHALPGIATHALRTFLAPLSDILPTGDQVNLLERKMLQKTQEGTYLCTLPSFKDFFPLAVHIVDNAYRSTY